MIKAKSRAPLDVCLEVIVQERKELEDLKLWLDKRLDVLAYLESFVKTHTDGEVNV